MGGVVDAVGGLFGVEGGDSVDPLSFSPRSVQTGVGTAAFGKDGDAYSKLSPELQQIFTGLLGRSQDQAQLAQSPQASLQFLQEQYNPMFQEQQTGLESRLFNQGLLGSTSGTMQQRELRQGQNQALMQQAMQQQQQAQQNSQGLLSQAIGLKQLPGQQIGLGSQLGQPYLQAQEGTAGLKQKAEDNQANFFSGLASAGATAAAFSDARLKNNITPIGGGWYTWEWNDEAKRIGADKYPTTGVIAQDLLETNPEAVLEGEHGYLMVDYSKVG